MRPLVKPNIGVSRRRRFVSDGEGTVATFLVLSYPMQNFDIGGVLHVPIKSFDVVRGIFALGTTGLV